MSTFVSVRNAVQNHILAALGPPERDRVVSQMRPTTLALGQVLAEAHQQLSHAYFPINSVVSLVYTTEDGASAEMAIVGSDGVVGSHLCLGAESTCSRAIVAAGGEALQIPAKLLVE